MKANFRLIKNDSTAVSKPRCLMCGHDKHSDICTKTVREKGGITSFRRCGCSNHRPDGGLKIKMAA